VVYKFCNAESWDDSHKPDQTLAVTRQLLADDKPLALAVALTRPA